MNRRRNELIGSPDLRTRGRETITIRAGPFTGIEGTLVKSSRRRARVAVDSPSGPLEIEIDCSKVSAARPLRRPLRIQGAQRRIGKTG